MHVGSVYFKHTYMHTQFKKKSLEKQEQGNMDSSSMKLDYADAFEFISCQSLLPQTGEGNGNAIYKQLNSLPAINRRSVSIT